MSFPPAETDQGDVFQPRGQSNAVTETKDQVETEPATVAKTQRPTVVVEKFLVDADV